MPTSTLEVERPLDSPHLPEVSGTLPVLEESIGYTVLKSEYGVGGLSTSPESTAGRALVGIVDEDTEKWLQSIWDVYVYNPGDESQTKNKLARDQKNRAALIELSEYLNTFTDDTEAVVKDFINTFGIANFGRYDPIMLYNQYSSWKTGNLDGFDTLCIAAQKGDSTGAYDNLVEYIEHGDGNTMIFETDDNPNNLADIPNKLAEKGAAIRQTVVSAHGSLEGDIPDLGIDNQTNLREFAASLHRLSHGMLPVVILDSCLAGYELVKDSTLVQILSNVMPGVCIVGANKAIIDTKVAPDGSISFDNRDEVTDTRGFIDLRTGEEYYSRLQGSLVKPRPVVFMNGKQLYVRGGSFKAPRLKSTIKLRD